MVTEFKLLFEGEPDLEMDKFQRSLPPGFHVENRNDGIYVAVESAFDEDERCQYLIERELDRHLFLTCVKIRAEMVRTKMTKSIKVSWRVHGSLPDDIRPQKWNYQLPIQLRLWSTAADTADPTTKLLLLFQIIELELPKRNQYPEYTDFSEAPHPLAECKFIRDLVAHSGDVSNKQLKLYCTYLGVPEIMLDITDPHYYEIIAAKVPLMQMEARKIIESALKSGWYAETH